jgi:hypothetical protein
LIEVHDIRLEKLLELLLMKDQKVIQAFSSLYWLLRTSVRKIVNSIFYHPPIFR